MEKGPQIFAAWLTVVTENEIKGKRTHDARIAAVMSVTDISHVLTLNPTDFSGIPGVSVVCPQNIDGLGEIPAT